MRIGLISDTHGDLEAWERALQFLKDIDFAIHAGDILSSGPFNPRGPSYKPLELAKAINAAPFPTIFAKGNCDAPVDSNAIAYPIQSPFAFVYAEGLRIMATHGDIYSEDKLIEIGTRYALDLIISGHTHVRSIKAAVGITLVNPGSASLPKGGEGDFPTIGLIEDRVIRLISLEDGTEVERASF
ncbi:MAG: phosphodiesterase [Firmicutes bacterium]|nr:phosphodiesterase [Bacillota bacterium]